MRTRLALLSLLILGGAAQAQTVSVTGSIEALVVAPICAPGATHKLAGTDVHLFSSTLDLTTVSTIHQTFTGNQTAASCPLLDVTAVAPSAYTVFACNSTALGCPFTLDQCPSPADGSYFLGASLGTGYFPLGPAQGTVLLDTAGFFTVATGTSTAVCQSTPVTIQGPASLVGTTFNVQGLTVTTAGELLMSNLAPITVDPPGFCTAFFCY